MISAAVIKKLAKQAGVSAEQLERDYVMSLILDALTRVPEAKGKIIFKGGCCVHKCFSSFSKPENPKEVDPYFMHGRFSSDIDLTVSSDMMNSEQLTQLFESAASYLKETHGLVIRQFSFPMHFNEKQQKTNSRSTLHYEGPLYLEGVEKKKEKARKKGTHIPLPNAPELKLDLTADEAVVYNPEIVPLYHPYSDTEPELNLQTYAYTLQGMFAEKIRALFERCSPRDLYDLHILMSHPDINQKKEEIGRAIIGKFKFKNVKLALTEDVLLRPDKNGESLKDKCRTDWEFSLKHQVKQLGRFHDFWDTKKFPKIIQFAQECVDLVQQKTKQQLRQSIQSERQ